VSLIEIRLSRSTPTADGAKLNDAPAKLLLRATARLSPKEVIFVLPPSPEIRERGRGVAMVVPCFRRATSIELDTRCLRIMPPPAGAELPALETLSISGNIVGIGTFLSRCPRLRVLGITFRGVKKPTSLEAELATLEAAAALGLVVSRLGIELDNFSRNRNEDGANFASLLHAASRLTPKELLFTTYFPKHFDADLVCFPHTTSIELNLPSIRFTQLSAGEFSALERLALKGCT
jgi:hypothetical protein